MGIRGNRAGSTGSSAAGRHGSGGPGRVSPARARRFDRVAGLLVAVRDVLVITLGRPRAQIGRRLASQGFKLRHRATLRTNFGFIVAMKLVSQTVN
jgi:hypothetical protein